MMFEIYLRFRTKPGESIFIGGEICTVLGYDKQDLLELEYVDQNFWKLNLNLPDEFDHLPSFFSYYFLFLDVTGQKLRDSHKARKISKTWLKEGNRIIDTWNDVGAVENVFLTSPFKYTFKLRKEGIQKITQLRKKIRFCVKAPVLTPDQSLAITGNIEVLGKWLSTEPINMKFDGDTWYADLEQRSIDTVLEYKYVVFSSSGKLVAYEEGENRKLDVDNICSNKLYVNDGFARLNFQIWKGTGIAIPVFSLRSHSGFGIGEFNDIIALVDWAKQVSIKMIQLLPVNDTTATHSYLDSYPYAAISAFALHPIYINLNCVAGKKHAKLISSINNRKQELNALVNVSYEEVMDIKWIVLRKLYEADAGTLFNKKDFKDFFNKNEDWLVPYGLFSYLRDNNHTHNSLLWGKDAVYSPQMAKKYLKTDSKSKKEIELYFFIQYHLHKQLQKVHKYANDNGVILKGDIAIGVHKNGVDTWTQPELFHIDMQAGAPPDAFSEKGQNWGFPTYNWPRMHQDNYDWWKRRFIHMSNYFDAFRIDHILGFFRIWSIPDHAIEGIMGRFVPAIPISSEELEEKGILVSNERLCKPYINDTVLSEIAGNLINDLKEFLFETKDGNYSFKQEFSTQRMVNEYFIDLQNSDYHKRLKKILFDLHSNVIFWEESDGKYHFRFNVFKTTSFIHLEESIKKGLLELYNDYFFSRQDQLWKKEAMDKLPILKSFTDMLICGEDLGMIPNSVPEVMASLGILSMEVQRMPKKYHSMFFDPGTSSYLSVVTPSTHDMSTIREWWGEDKNRTQLFFNEQIAFNGLAPDECTPEIARRIIEQHLNSPAMWAVFQMQDIFSIHNNYIQHSPSSERINIPGNPHHYWRYRMPINLECLIDNSNYNSDLRLMIKNSGR